MQEIHNPSVNWKTLLIAINSRYTHSNPGVYSLKAVSEAQGIQVDILETNININDLEIFKKIVTAINQDCYMAVAFSCYIWNVQSVLHLVQMLKQVFPDLKIILGGPEVTNKGKELLHTFPEIDYIIQGEGEIAFPSLISSIGQDLTLVPNLVWRSEKQIVINPQGDYIDLNKLPLYYDDETLTNMEHRIIYYESSRGCPFGCHFCASATEKVRYRDLDLVKADLLKLASSKCKKIKFVDRTFNSNKKRALEVISYLLDIYREDLCFHLELEPNCLDSNLVELLAKAPVGYIQVEIGIQSLCSTALQAINREELTASSKQLIINLIANDNVHVHLDLIAALPFESFNDFKNSFNQLYQLKPHYLQLGFLKVLPGSLLEKEVDKWQLIYDVHPPYQVLSTPWLSFADMLTLMDVEYAVDNYYNHGLWSQTIDLALKYWLDQGKTSFDFYLALAQLDKLIDGGKSDTSKADILYRLLLKYFPKQQELWRAALKLDCLLHGIALPVELCNDLEDNLLKDYQEELLGANEWLGEVPKKLWRKEVKLVDLAIDVGELKAGIYCLLLKDKIGIWQLPKIYKIAEKK